MVLTETLLFLPSYLLTLKNIHCSAGFLNRDIEGYNSEDCAFETWQLSLMSFVKSIKIFIIILYNEPTNAQLFHKLSHSYKFRHYRVILR